MNKNSHALREAALLIFGFLALSSAGLLRFLRSEVDVYGNFSPHDLSQNQMRLMLAVLLPLPTVLSTGLLNAAV